MDLSWAAAVALGPGTGSPLPQFAPLPLLPLTYLPGLESQNTGDGGDCGDHLDQPYHITEKRDASRGRGAEVPNFWMAEPSCFSGLVPFPLRTCLQQNGLKSSL